MLVPAPRPFLPLCPPCLSPRGAQGDPLPPPRKPPASRWGFLPWLHKALTHCSLHSEVGPHTCSGPHLLSRPHTDPYPQAHPQLLSSTPKTCRILSIFSEGLLISAPFAPSDSFPLQIPGVCMHHPRRLPSASAAVPGDLCAPKPQGPVLQPGPQHPDHSSLLAHSPGLPRLVPCPLGLAPPVCKVS